MCTKNKWNVTRPPTHTHSLEVTRGSVCMGEIAGQKPGWIFLESLSLAEQIRASQKDPQSFKVQPPSHERRQSSRQVLRSSKVRSIRLRTLEGRSYQCELREPRALR